MSNPTEYQDEYCGMGGSSNGGSTRKGKSNPTAVIVECTKSFDEQPVGGRAQARARAAAKGQGRLPAHDQTFVATVYSGEDRGTHRIQPHWRDHRWDDEMRADSSTLYEPADRDPPNRNNWYIYRTTLVDSINTPCKPLAVPDVHKLRYMQNNYMTADDWY